jgi:hypothetical protein
VTLNLHKRYLHEVSTHPFEGVPIVGRVARKMQRAHLCPPKNRLCAVIQKEHKIWYTFANYLCVASCCNMRSRLGKTFAAVPPLGDLLWIPKKQDDHSKMIDTNSQVCTRERLAGGRRPSDDEDSFTTGAAASDPIVWSRYPSSYLCSPAGACCR